MVAVKLAQIGNSVGIVLPKETLSRMNVAKGDTIFLTATADGYRLTPYTPEFEAQMKAAHNIMKTRRNALRALAE